MIYIITLCILGYRLGRAYGSHHYGAAVAIGIGMLAIFVVRVLFQHLMSGQNNE